MTALRILRCVLLAVLAFALIGVAPASAATARHSGPGTLVSAKRVAASPLFGSHVARYQIRYRTIDGTGDPVVATGVVLVPTQAYGYRSRSVVAWDHGTAGIADICAPSRFANLDPDKTFNVYADELHGFLADGHIVVAPDYVGLGSPGQHEYLIGRSEGTATIDAVRAARQLRIGASRDWVAVGHSQGGQAALFAGELARRYAPELKLRGVVAIAPASHLDLLAAALPGTPVQGYLALALKGLESVHPRFSALDVLADPADKLLPLTETGCFNALIAFSGLTADQMVEGGTVPDSVLTALAKSNPGQRPTAAPILLAQGTADDTIPRR